MTVLATQLPARRTDLVIRPIGAAGRYVVKDPSRRDYFELGEEEHFLLTQLDGERDADAVCDAFETQFGEPLTADDLDGFIEMAREQGLLEEGRGDTEKMMSRKLRPISASQTKHPLLAQKRFRSRPIVQPAGAADSVFLDT
jgi:hypothetical protein